MYILGISCYYHDAAACLVKDGEVVAAAEEERFTRKKHDSDFPINAINYCLNEANIKINDIDYIGFYEKPFIKFERLLFTFIRTYPKSLPQFIAAMPSWITKKLRLPSTIRKKLKYKGKILFIDHHMSHAASAFLPSKFREAAILTIDGVGEWSTATYGIGKNNSIELKKELKFPDSLGLLYSTLTAFLGFKVNNDEYKVMGLASYGQPKYYDKLKNIIKIFDDGSIQLDKKYFSYEYRLKMFSKNFIKKFGKPRKPESEIIEYHKDLAASLQKLTEDIIVKMADHVHIETKLTHLCLAGGVALNCVANYEILKRTKFKNLFIQPAAGDAGGALGTALYIYNVLLGNKRNYTMEHAYLGPSFSTGYVKEYLNKNKIPYQEFSENELIKQTARLIKNNYIVGWFQGRMEYGPRALGSRSILANPCNPDMKDILNDKVKHREDFRPFAPVSTKEDARTYFNMKQEDPFMVLVCDVKKEKRKYLPSITHSDGTARLQTIERQYNEKYYDLIKEFGKLSRVPVIINTSFNVRGMPIVCTPENAYNCFANTGIDYLVMDNFIISKKDIKQ